MSTQQPGSTHQPTSKPTGKAAKQQAEPLGILRSLVSGFDLVTRHPELMLMPLLLDLFLWLGPRLSPYSLFQAIGTMMPPIPWVQQLIEQAEPSIKFINLFAWLSPMVLGVPSLMAHELVDKIPSGTPTVWPVSNEWGYFGLFVVLSLIGLMLSAIYWAMLASRVREQPLSLGRIAALGWGWFKVACLLMGLALLLGFPTLIVVLLASLLNALVTQFVIIAAGSLMLWVLFYLAFTLHGIALRDVPVLQSIRTSVVLIQTQFPPAMGLLMASLGIYIGMGYVWSIPPNDTWLRAAGILGHAFTATGLLTATALFYLDRTKPVESHP